MRHLLLFFALFACAVSSFAKSDRVTIDKDNCTLTIKSPYEKDKVYPLYGKVELVKCGADLKVEIVDIGADLKVELVNLGATSCGKVELVDIGADLKVEIVDIGADLEVELVNLGAGVR